MMLAIPVWQGRVSPVFDVAGRVLLVDIEKQCELSRREAALPEEPLDLRARRVADLGATALICGAISRPLESLLSARGIDVIPRVCGDVEEILLAFCSGAVQDGRFDMPGCGGQRRRRRRGRCRRQGTQPP